MILYEDNFFLEAVQEPLVENFFTQWLTGHNDDTIPEMRRALAGGIKTEGERRAALEKIDDMLDNSNRVIYTASNLQHVLGDIAAGALTGGMSLWIKAIVRMAEADKRKAFRETLYAIRSQIVALKLKG